MYRPFCNLKNIAYLVDSRNSLVSQVELMSLSILEMRKLWISNLSRIILLESSIVRNLLSSQELSHYTKGEKKLIFTRILEMVSWLGGFSTDFCVTIKT